MILILDNCLKKKKKKQNPLEAILITLKNPRDRYRYNLNLQFLVRAFIDHHHWKQYSLDRGASTNTVEKLAQTQDTVGAN